MFDLDYLTNSMNYEPVLVENQANKSAGPREANNSAGTQASDDQGVNSKEINLNEEHFVPPIWSAYSTTVKSSGDKIEKNTGSKTCEKPVSQVEQVFLEELEKLKRQEKEANDADESLRKEATYDIQNASTSSTNQINTASTPLNDLLMPHLKDIYASPSEGIFIDSSSDDEGMVTDFNNLETTMSVSPTPTTRIHTIHPKTQILRDPKSAVQTRSKVNKTSEAHALYWKMKVRLMLCKRNCYSSNFRRNKKDERGVVVRNNARLVAHGHSQKEGIDYDDVFAHVARIEAIRIFLAFASYMGFIVYQMDVKSAFMYGTIDEEVVKTASTPIETQKPLVKDKEAVDVDVCLYRFQVTPKTLHLHVVKRIFRDAYEKKIIQVLKIHTDDNVADLLTKDFDVSWFNFVLTMLYSKELASPKQTALGKDISNPLMAGRLPKTTFTTSHRLYKDVDPHEFTHV
nr:hypothetical protein [Tanacetum cinerariifolium]